MHCECGLDYMPGVDDDVHAKRHAEYQNGPAIEVLSKIERTDSIGQLALIVVDAKLRYPIRKQIAKVAEVAHYSMQQYPIGYHGTVTEDDQTMLVLADGTHGVAMLLHSLDSSFWRLSWRPEGDLQLDDQSSLMEERRTVGRIWVAKAYRRTSLATYLVQSAATLCGVSVKDLGWELPLTDDGAALLRTVLPTRWLGRGDVFALKETLDKYGEGT